jgi:hypothetical protein
MKLSENMHTSGQPHAAARTAGKLHTAAASNATHYPTHRRTLPRELPHTSAHCRAYLCTLTHTATSNAGQPHVAASTATRCRESCRTLPHCCILREFKCRTPHIAHCTPHAVAHHNQNEFKWCYPNECIRIYTSLCEFIWIYVSLYKAK